MRAAACPRLAGRQDDLRGNQLCRRFSDRNESWNPASHQQSKDVTLDKTTSLEDMRAPRAAGPSLVHPAGVCRVPGWLRFLPCALEAASQGPHTAWVCRRRLAWAGASVMSVVMTHLSECPRHQAARHPEFIAGSGLCCTVLGRSTFHKYNVLLIDAFCSVL